MLKRAFFVLALVFVPALASADAIVPYDAAEFAAAQAAGRSILLQFHADWCPSCAAQRPVLDELALTERFGGFVRFNIDWDTQKDLVRQFEVPGQSTLVVFKGAVETGRGRGMRDMESISELLATGL